MRKIFEGSALRDLNRIFVSGTQIGLPDGELLTRFVDSDGEAAQSAFAALVQRHGPMVLRICRQLLVDSHESQDAFQATFLILVRKAGSLRDRQSVGPWLFGVACRVAAKSRGSSARRMYHEQRYVEQSGSREPDEDPDRSELYMIIHEEIGRLPVRYRIPVVLCYLEGVTQEQAAGQLGWPIGTVRSRLARARERLRGRLTRRGIALSTGALVGTLATTTSGASPLLVDCTVSAAMAIGAGRASTATAGVVPASVEALMREVLRSFFMIRLKIAATILATLGTTAIGAGVSVHEPGTSETVASSAPAEPGFETQGAEAGSKVVGRIGAEEREEHRAKEKAAIERLHKALERASRAQLIKAILAAGPDERSLRILEGEETEEHRAKEKELMEHRAKEKELMEHRAKEKEVMEHRTKEKELIEHRTKEKELMEHRAKEKELMEHRAKEKQLMEHRAKEKELMEHQAKEKELMEHRAKEKELRLKGQD
jgi:RNA polymerase sigma factor (sigma-70 family)